MDRRRFLLTSSAGAVAALLVIGLLTTPVVAPAQPDPQAPRIGFIWGGTSPPPSLLRDFEDALREVGWISGRNITIEHRVAEGRSKRLPQLAADLVQARVSVMLTSQSPATQATKKASGTFPSSCSVTAILFGTVWSPTWRGPRAT